MRLRGRSRCHCRSGRNAIATSLPPCRKIAARCGERGSSNRLSNWRCLGATRSPCSGMAYDLLLYDVPCVNQKMNESLRQPRKGEAASRRFAWCGEAHGRKDDADHGICLGEVTPKRARGWIQVLGQQTHVIPPCEHLLKQLACLLDSAYSGEGF